ncbi:MAG: hypothetical protein E7006_04350 [Alphaproteobacteria bacterium]|nr:hypothetical protein [Alphaproteobacteria bacterium]
MTQKEYIFSNAGLIKSVERSAEHPYAVKEVDTIDVGKPTLVLFGGEYTYVPQSANHYIKQMKSVLEISDINIADIDIYSVYYEFGSRHADVERTELFRAAGRKIKEQGHKNAIQFRHEKSQLMKQNEPTPKYIEKLYLSIIQPLIVSSDGVLLDKKTITDNLKKLRMYGYSHGAAAIYMLGQYAQNELKRLGFKAAEIHQMLQNVIVIQFGPVSPLEHPAFKTLSFMSGADTRVDGFNKFSEYMYDNAENLYPAYFNQLGTHLFIAGKLSERFDSEHNDDGLLNERNLTEDGKLIFNAERYAINNAVRSAIESSTPDIKTLVSGPGVDFDEMKSNGEIFYDRMVSRLRAQKQNLKSDYQK